MGWTKNVHIMPSLTDEPDFEFDSVKKMTLDLLKGRNLNTEGSNVCTMPTTYSSPH